MTHYTKNPPTFEFERPLWNKGSKYVVGIDEVGRGALAGPVVVAATCFDQNHIPIIGIHDSKKLSNVQRESLVGEIYTQAFFCEIGQASITEINQLGIVPATMLAITRALQNIPTFDHILMDGKPFTQKNMSRIKNWPIQPFSFIVKGDQLSYSIAAASIVAKVFRDEMMKKLAEQHAGYSWETNVGYGTKSHLAAIQKNGLTTHHRLTFCH